jgi:endonuclease IV
MINQISKFIGKFMGLVFGPENHTSHVELDKPIELNQNWDRENQSNRIESIKALKEIDAFNHDSLNGKHYTNDEIPVPISEPTKDEPIKNEHVQEIIKQENQSEIPNVVEIPKLLTFAEKIELIRSKRDKK